MLYILLFQVPDYLMPWLLLIIKHMLPISELYSSFRRTDLTTGDIYTFVLFACVDYLRPNKQFSHVGMISCLL